VPASITFLEIGAAIGAKTRSIQELFHRRHAAATHGERRFEFSKLGASRGAKVTNITAL
jgi:hypothetical protein